MDQLSTMANLETGAKWWIWIRLCKMADLGTTVPLSLGVVFGTVGVFHEKHQLHLNAIVASSLRVTREILDVELIVEMMKNLEQDVLGMLWQILVCHQYSMLQSFCFIPLFIH